MLRNPKPAQNNYTYLWIIGAVAVGVILVVVGVLIGLAIQSSQSSKPTALPEGYAQTAIVLTQAAYPTDTPVPTAIFTNTPNATNTLLPTLTPLVQVTQTAPRVAAIVAPTSDTMYIGGTEVSSAYFITPVSVVRGGKGCACEADAKVTCADFRLPVQAQNCYDICRAILCVDEATYETCDPWGLDASDGSLDSEHYVCGND
jgi:hypothetical protein